MLRSLNASNAPAIPTTLRRYNTGPPSSSLMRQANTKIKGKENSSRTAAPVRSIRRFTKRELRRNGSHVSCVLRSSRRAADDDTSHSSSGRTAWRYVFKGVEIRLNHHFDQLLE